ncbi:hypothetical protein EVAR_54103_1 [Eumeta japonica]|uniref:Uncharacterized protein n=1 Tax=Eumeta variegata TaxID=151549 RepID=A0A4C1Z7K0_EUMVA|nr:hypothetical protein EVAR_54103_1 [Eumeta japonica]
MTLFKNRNHLGLLQLTWFQNLRCLRRCGRNIFIDFLTCTNPTTRSEPGTSNRAKVQTSPLVFTLRKVKLYKYSGAAPMRSLYGNEPASNIAL